MSSLAHCLELATDLTDSEKNYVTAKVKAYKDVGDTTKDAINDIISDLVFERADIVKQIQAKTEVSPGVKPWAEGFPKIISHTNVNKIHTHPDHEAAKAGDMDAAIRLVDDRFNIVLARALGERHPEAMIVGVQAVEKTGRNKIPSAFADALQAATGLDLDTDIVQVNITGHTEKNALQRMLTRAKFDGKVEKGRDYILLDDVITQGGTLSALKQYIEGQGGNVVEITSLASAQFSSVIAITPETVEKLVTKYGRQELESILKEIGIPPLLESLTQSEGRQLNLYKGPDSLRSAIAKERHEEGAQEGPGVLPEQVQESLVAKGGPTEQIADWVADTLDKAEPITWRQLFAKADKAFGGTQAEGVYSVKDAYDAMEIGINTLVSIKHRDVFNPSQPTAKQAQIAVRLLKQYGNLLPTQTKRTEEMDEFQQFSTPPPLAFVAAWAANLTPADQVTEPSAGTANIAVFAKNAGAKVTVNELSKRRFELLKLFDFDAYYNEDAGQINNILSDKLNPTVVLMNPPFTASAGRLKKGKRSVTIGQRHVSQAAALLQPGGRLVAIMGNNMAPETGAYKIWARRIAQKGMAIRANISISGQEYKKYGTTWDNQLIILDKTPGTYDIITGKVDLIEDLLPLIEDIRNDRADKGKRASGEPESEGVPKQDEVQSGTGTSLLPSTGGLGDTGGPLQTQKPGTGLLPGGLPPGTPQQSSLFSTGGRGEQPGSGDVRSEGPTGGGLPGPRSDTYTSHTVRSGLSKTDPSAIAQELDIKAKEAEAKGEITDDLYEGYEPERMSLKGMQKHPTPLVQSAAMASVSPPKPTYKPKLPLKAIKAGKISDIQVEAIVYAGQAHNEFLPDEYRMGYFIGDGTGVGKGREIAGIIWDNWNRGRKKAVWVSEKDGLFKDAIRDFDDVGWSGNKLFNHSKIKATLKNKYGEKRSSHILATEGVLFTTYSKLGTSRTDDDYLSRFDQIVEWLGEDFDGVIAFDESHNLGNSIDSTTGRYRKKASAQGLAGVALQARLPKARIVYCSATGATEVMNLAYAERLGLWGEGTAFPDKNDFIQKMSSGGIAAMEQVARDMKALGVYTSRALSYEGVEQDVLLHELSKDQVINYNKFAEAWQVVLNNMNQALQLTGAIQPHPQDPNATVTVNAQAVSNAMSAFWGGHQRFFNQIITSMQTPSVLKAIKADLKAGRSPVIQLTNTLEAAAGRALARLGEDQTLDELDLTPRDGLMQMVQASFPVAQIETYVDDNGNERSRVVRDSKGNIVINPEAVALREKLLDEVGAIAVPQGALDMILDEFGPDMVAEVTGRSRRVITKITDKGDEKVIERWSRTKSTNDAELFMAGKKQILVFSEAGGTGRSYHSSLMHKNQKQRVHYLLQAGWRADKAVQGLGRTHRSNQKQPPMYYLVSTDLKGQKRFIATIARRLDQLGALTKGQRETGSSGIFNAKDNLESEYAETALRVLYADLAAGNVPSINIDDFMKQTGLKLVDPQTGGLLSGLPPMKTFMNRLLSLNVETQNSFFDEFMIRMDRIIDAHVEAGTLDQGLETLKADKIEKVSEEVVREDERTGAQTKYVQLDVTRPTAIMGFADADFYSDNFYRNKRSGKVWSQKRIVKTDRDGGNAEWHYVLKGEQYQSQSIKESQWNEEKWDKLSKKGAKSLWDAQVEDAPKQRTDQYHLITGTLLPIWDRLIGHPRIFRIQTEAGERMVGRLIPPAHLTQTLTNIGAEAAKIDISPEQIFEKVLTDGQTITFANGIKLTRRMVSGDERIEITELEYNQFTPLEQKGAFSERIDWRTRFFVPTDLAAGTRVIESILSNNPVVLQEGGTQTRSYRLGDKKATAKRGPYDEKAMTILIKGWLNKAGFDKDVMDRLDLFLRSEINEEGVEGVILGTTLLKRQRAIIELAMAVQDLKSLEKTTYHEAFHLAVSWILPQKDMAELLRHYGNEEAAAEAFAQYMAKRSTIFKVPSPIRKLLMKIQRVLQIIRNGLRGLGFTRPQDVFGQLSVGAYRPHFKDRKGKKYQVEAWHGSGAQFDKFSTMYAGQGEGAASFGWGLYFTDVEEIARHYTKTRHTYTYDTLEDLFHDNDEMVFSTRDKAEYAYGVSDWVSDVSPKDSNIKSVWVILNGMETEYTKKSDGKWAVGDRNLYKVTLHEGKDPSEYDWLMWNERVTPEQIAKIKAQIKKEGLETPAALSMSPLPGHTLYYGLMSLSHDIRREADKYHESLREKYNLKPRENLLERISDQERKEIDRLNDKAAASPEKVASLFLLRAGIDGVKYETGTLSGRAGEGTSNYVVFDENAVTIDEHIRYRVRQESEEADHEKSWAAATMLSLKEFGAAFKNPKAGFIEGKADTTVLDRLISTPSHYFKKIGATRRMFEGAMRYPDNQQDFVNAITRSSSKGDFFTTRLEQLKKQLPKEYEELKGYLVNRDIDQVGHTVKQDDTGKIYTAYDPKGKAVGRATSEPSAWAMAVTDEFNRYLEAGHSEQASEALRGFRTMMHNGFNILYSNMRNNIERLEALGLPMPEVAVWSGGEKVIVNLKLALDMMGDLRGFYFPRQRQTGRFMITAVRESDGSRFMDYRDHKTTAQHLVNKMKLKGYKASYKKSKALPEDVFEMARSTVAIQAEINAALERIGAKGGVSLEDFGLKRVSTITDTMKASFTEEEVNEFEKDFLITGPWNKEMSGVFKAMGGKWFRAERIWHFFNPPKDFEQRLVKALLHKVDIVDRQMATLFAKSLTEQAANVIKARGHRVHMIQRATAKGEEVWAGYETDPAIASASYAKGLSSGESKRILAGDLVGAMTGTDYSWDTYKNDMRRIREKPNYEEYLKIVDKRRIDPTEQKNAFRDAKTYMEDLLRNQEWIDRFIGGVKGVAVLKYLSGRVSAPIVNLTAMVTSVPASMNGFADIPMKAIPQLLKDSAKHYTLYKLGRKTEIPPDALLALDHITDKAWDKSQYNQEAFSVLESKLKGGWRKLLEYSMLAFGASEQLNRGATILGTYMGIKARGGRFNHAQALELSRTVSDQAHGVYGKINYPFMARGSNPAAQLIKSFYVFRTFSHNYLLTMKDLWGHSWKPEHAKAFNYMLISPAIVAGTGATIATPIVSALLKMAGLGGDDPEEQLYNWIGTEMGDYAENMARFGMFGMAGVSLKGSLQIGITDIPTTIPEVLGAPGSMVIDLYYGGKSIARGDVSKGIEKILPLFAGNVLKGWREGTEGITTGSNAPIFHGREPLVADTVDAMLRMLSFNPSRIAAIRERQWKERQVEFKYRKIRSDIYAKFKKFYLGDKKDRTKANYIDLISEVRQYNVGVKGKGLVERGIPLISKRSIETNLRRAFRPNKRERLRHRRNQ